MPYPIYYRGILDISPRLTLDDAELFSALRGFVPHEGAAAVLAEMRITSRMAAECYAGMLRMNSLHTSLQAGKEESWHGVSIWLQLLINHFFAPRSYALNGQITWKAREDSEDRGSIFVKDNRIEIFHDLILNPGPSWEPTPFADARLKQMLQELIDSEDATGCSDGLTVVSSSAVEALRDRSSRF